MRVRVAGADVVADVGVGASAAEATGGAQMSGKAGHLRTWSPKGYQSSAAPAPDRAQACRRWPSEDEDEGGCEGEGKGEGAVESEGDGADEGAVSEGEGESEIEGKAENRVESERAVRERGREREKVWLMVRPYVRGRGGEYGQGQRQRTWLSLDFSGDWVQKM